MLELLSFYELFIPTVSQLQKWIWISNPKSCQNAAANVCMHIHVHCVNESRPSFHGNFSSSTSTPSVWHTAPHPKCEWTFFSSAEQKWADATLKYFLFIYIDAMVRWWLQNNNEYRKNNNKENESLHAFLFYQYNFFIPHFYIPIQSLCNIFNAYE